MTALKGTERLLVLSVDRDDDLGRKTGIKGPVIGEKDNLKAATELAVTDPAEADANCIFAAVKKYREIKKTHPNIEVCTLTGHSKQGFQSDRMLIFQLEAVLKKIGGTDGFVLVTDGAEDDQIIPLLQGRGKIFSKETVIVKQAQIVESTYYTIKEALKDPFLARIVFGIPGIVLLLFFALGTVSLQILSLALGFYLLLKGFGIEEKIISFAKSVTASITVQRTSFPFYIASLFILGFGAVTAYTSYTRTPLTDPFLDIASITRSTFVFIFLSALAIAIAKGIDAVHLKKAFKLRKYVLSAITIPLVWLILDSGTLVLLRQADLNLFLFSVISSFAVMLLALRATKIMDVRERLTALLIGLPVYDENGLWVGKVQSIDKRKNAITYNDTKTNTEQEISNKKFKISANRILITG